MDIFVPFENTAGADFEPKISTSPLRSICYAATRGPFRGGPHGRHHVRCTWASSQWLRGQHGMPTMASEASHCGWPACVTCSTTSARLLLTPVGLARCICRPGRPGSASLAAVFAAALVFRVVFAPRRRLRIAQGAHFATNVVEGAPQRGADD